MTSACVFVGGVCNAVPGDDPAVVHFMVAAKKFCRLVESEIALPKWDFIHELLIASLALYTAGAA